MTEYLEINRSNWDARVPFHEHGYGLQPFRDDPTQLSEGVRIDAERLGDIVGKDVVHLQCHMGHDTLSLARLGARVTGLDFSGAALEVARRLAADCGTEITYVESDVYGAVDALGAERFDIVYTGLGSINWLPSIARWAEVVAALLRPGGMLLLRDVHPMLGALDITDEGRVLLAYPYFEWAGEIRESDEKSYIEHEGALAQPRTIQYAHGLGETFMALQAAGMRVTLLEEHESVFWNAFPGHMVEDDAGEYRLRDHPERLAGSFTLQAVKEIPG